MWTDLSVVLCTWNRLDLLSGAVDALLTQRDAPPHEILIVDNASTDGTPAYLETIVHQHPHVRAVREPRQGLSFARNTGIAAARGRIVAFTDDDVRVGDRWLSLIGEAFARHPTASYIGGSVLPRWGDNVPAWLTRDHWAPLGVQDYGSQLRQVDRRDPICLIGANFSVRRSAFDSVGLFNPAVQRVCDGFGSTEDQEWQVRAWGSALYGIYDPRVQVNAVITAERITKAHHRTWHFGHGRHVARMRLPEVEQSRWHPLGVPVHLVRQAVGDARGWLVHTVKRENARAFAHEARLCFAAGFLRERLG